MPTAGAVWPSGTKTGHPEWEVWEVLPQATLSALPCCPGICSCRRHCLTPRSPHPQRGCPYGLSCRDFPDTRASERCGEGQVPALGSVDMGKEHCGLAILLDPFLPGSWTCRWPVGKDMSHPGPRTPVSPQMSHKEPLGTGRVDGPCTFVTKLSEQNKM